MNFSLEQVLNLYRKACFDTRTIVTIIRQKKARNIVPAAPYVWGDKAALHLAVQVTGRPHGASPAFFATNGLPELTRWHCVNYEDLGPFTDYGLVEFAQEQTEKLGGDYVDNLDWGMREVMNMYTSNYPALRDHVNGMVTAGLKIYPMVVNDPLVALPDAIVVTRTDGASLWVEPINGSPEMFRRVGLDGTVIPGDPRLTLGQIIRWARS